MTWYYRCLVMLLVVSCNLIGAQGPIGYAGRETRVYLDLVFFRYDLGV